MKNPHFRIVCAGLLACSTVPFLSGCNKPAAPAPAPVIVMATPVPTPTPPPPTPVPTPVPPPPTPIPTPVPPPPTPVPTPVPVPTPPPITMGPIDFGDGRSETITAKAWMALQAQDYNQVITYAMKCIDSFKQPAIEQQKSLQMPETEKDKIFAKWALNDVATCYYLLGYAYEKQHKNAEAVAAYQFMIDNLSFGQCYDPQNQVFWSPAKTAKDRVTGIKLGGD